MKYLLFTTQNCPKCPEVKLFVKENVSFKGEILDNTSPNFGKLASNYGVMEAPTFLVLDDEENEIFRSTEVYQIEEFLKGV